MEAVKKSKLEGGGGEDARLQSAFPSIPPAFLELRKKQQIRNLSASSVLFIFFPLHLVPTEILSLFQSTVESDRLTSSRGLGC